jgi:hypothetical protein
MRRTTVKPHTFDLKVGKTTFQVTTKPVSDPRYPRARTHVTLSVDGKPWQAWYFEMTVTPATITSEICRIRQGATT